MACKLNLLVVVQEAWQEEKWGEVCPDPFAKQFAVIVCIQQEETPFSY